MKRVAFLLAGLGLASTAVLAEEAKVEVKNEPNHKVIEKKHKRGGSTDTTKVESKSRHRLGGGTVSTTETTVDHDRPGIGNGSKTTVTETKEKDEHGNEIRHEKKVTH